MLGRRNHVLKLMEVKFDNKMKHKDKNGRASRKYSSIVTLTLLLIKDLRF